MLILYIGIFYSKINIIITNLTSTKVLKIPVNKSLTVLEPSYIMVFIGGRSEKI